MKKVDLKKIKEGVFAFVVCFMCILVVGTIAIIANDGLNSAEEIVMTDSKEISFVNPLENVEVVKDYSENRLQFNSTLKQWEAHKAIDLKAAVGTKVFAVESGEIVGIETTHLYGTTITIKHADGFESRYSSLSDKVSVSVGDKVSAGAEIGTVDNSAKGELEGGSHLHFELLKNEKKVDPNLYFSFGQK